MKEIEAIIKPFMLAKVQEALQATPGFPGMTVSECRGIGHDSLERSSSERPGLEFVHKIKIEILASDEIAEHLAEVIMKAAHTGHPGDGLVHITDVDKLYRIRNFEGGL